MSDKDLLRELIKEFYPYSKERLGFKEGVKSIMLKEDEGNAKNPFGKTAYYEPSTKVITLFITNRHPKDVMRSLSHELTHHSQNCSGKFNNMGEVGEGYAQSNKYLRELEREAYEKGNLIFRDFEDKKKKENPQMKTLQEIFNHRGVRLNKMLHERFNMRSMDSEAEEGSQEEYGLSGEESITVPAEIAPLLSQWHNGSEDPIYKTAALAHNEEKVPRDLVVDTIEELESIYDSLQNDEDMAEIDTLIVTLKHALDPPPGPTGSLI